MDSSTDRSRLPGWLRGDSHPELPLDPDTPLHLRPGAIALVAAGGIAGAGTRIAAGVLHPTATGTWPWTTFAVNVVGAVVLGVLLEGLARAGSDDGWRRRARLLGGTGFCGALTTYSTLAVEVGLLGRDARPGIALAYLAASVAAGLVATATGIAAAARAVRADGS